MIKVYFDGIEVPGDYIRSLSQSAQMFSNNFRVGATVCRSFELSVDNRVFSLVSGLSLAPSSILLYEDSTLYATLLIDELDTSNVVSTDYTLTDSMVRLSGASDWYESAADNTIQGLITSICSEYSLGTAPTITDYASLEVSWDTDITARDFIGYYAELIGGYAYIDNDGTLKFKAFSNTPTDTISADDCDSFRVVQTFTIDRVVYEASARSVQYPESYSGTGATLYLNPDNVLFTDTDTVTIENQVEAIYNVINGFTFNAITVGKAPINGDVKCGDTIAFTYDGTTYYSIAEIDWQYNSMWLGGYKLEITTSTQQETQIITATQRATNSIRQYIDREIGEVGVQIQSVVEDVGVVSQELSATASQLTAKFDDYVLTQDGDYQRVIGTIQASSSGILIARSDVETQFELKADGAYIEDSNGNSITSMTATEFQNGEWVMQQSNNNIVFNIFRRDS